MPAAAAAAASLPPALVLERLESGGAGCRRRRYRAAHAAGTPQVEPSGFGTSLRADWRPGLHHLLRDAEVRSHAHGPNVDPTHEQAVVRSGIEVPRASHFAIVLPNRRVEFKADPLALDVAPEGHADVAHRGQALPVDHAVIRPVDAQRHLGLQVVAAAVCGVRHGGTKLAKRCMRCIAS